MKKTYLHRADKSFRTQEQSSFDSAVPVSKPLKVARNSISYRSNPKPVPSRSISVTKDPTLTQSPAPAGELSYLGLDFSEIHEIFASRCEDLNIPVFPDQEKRFFNYCCLHFRDRRFEMSESGIGTRSARVIGNILKNNFNFAYVNLSKNTIKDAGVQDLLSCLKNSSHIVHLDISSNDITPDGAKTIFKMLEKNESLFSLDLSSHEGLHRNRICFEGSLSLSRFLANNRILAYLNISGTSLGAEGLAVLIKGLENNVSLHSLNLAFNSIGAKAVESLAVALVSTDIKELNLAGNKLGNEGCEFLSKMLSGDYEGFCTLMKIDISENEITTKGLSQLLASIRINIQLNWVSLKKNNFSSGLSEDFLQLLTDNNYLDFLDFSNCNLKCAGLSGIGEGLSRNKCLRTLVLSCNKLKDRAVEMICFGLSKNKTLKVVDLTSNEIKNKGAALFAQVLKTNTSLEGLLLKDNSIKDSGGQALCEAARFNQNILKISLELNPLNFKFIAEVKDLTKVNISLKKRKIIPILINEIDKNKHQGKNIDGVFARITQKRKEKVEAENKVKVQGDKLEVMKQQEKAKLDELKNEFSTVKSHSFALSAEVENLNNMIYVRFK
jgi:Ran GTPase-activating protein (RanGAP) involved in mRNA processing and transport